MAEVTRASGLAELRKLPAFARRDVLTALSYRTAFASDAVGMVIQAVGLSFLGRLVNPEILPTYGGQSSRYLEFIITGLTVGGLVELGMGKLTAVVRQEQLMGTLEALYATPTSTATIQLGSVVYDLLYVPLRTGFLLIFATLALGVNLEWSSLGSALAVLMAMLPAVWGIGLVGAAGVLTFRRGLGMTGLVAAVLGFASGVYIPLDVLPQWLQWVATINPIAIALDAVRDALMGGVGWADVAETVPRLVAISAVALFAGATAFALALTRERRLGTLGQY